MTFGRFSSPCGSAFLLSSMASWALISILLIRIDLFEKLFCPAPTCSKLMLGVVGTVIPSCARAIVTEFGSGASLKPPAPSSSCVVVKLYESGFAV